MCLSPCGRGDPQYHEGMPEPTDICQQKQQVRAAARANRQKQPNKDQLSRQICQKLAALPEYTAARVVMFYVDFASEVRTQHFFPTAWAAGKQIVVPYCVKDRLELFRLENTDELAPGTVGILEPRPELRGRPDRQVDVAQLDLILLPGLAFDRRGGRIGRGKGYYDRFLRRVRPGTPLVALAFECQLFAEVPMLPYDKYVDKVITEASIYTGGPPT